MEYRNGPIQKYINPLHQQKTMKNEIFSQNLNSNENTEKISYLSGFIIGDGNLGKGYIIRAVEENKGFIEDVFCEIFNDVFNRKPKIYFDKFNNSFVAYVHCKEIWNYLAVNVGIETRTKSRTVKTPSMILNGSEKIKSAFISGIFDAEGSVIIMNDNHHKSGYLRIQLKMCSHDLVSEISTFLSELGIKNRLYKYNTFSMIQINGKEQCGKFKNIIGFKHSLKNAKLRAFL